MTRKNKKKNQNKPMKSKGPPPSFSNQSASSCPPPYSEIDYLDQEPSEPPPRIDLSFAIPKNTEANFSGVMRNKLRQSFQLYGKVDAKSEDIGPVETPTDFHEILYKLIYPTPEENWEDYLVHKNELMEMHNEQDPDESENLFKKLSEYYFYFETSAAIKISEIALYRSYGHCPQKAFVLRVHEDLHRIYACILERNVNEELKRIMDYVNLLENRDEIEKSCSTKKSMLEFFAKNPHHYLHRELFKSCLLFCDLIGITVRTHMALINEIEESFVLDDMPRDHRYPRQNDFELDSIRQNRDKNMHYLSHSHRIILANLVKKMPKFLGTAVDEYLEYDENVKKWLELKKLREEEARTKPRLRLNVDNLLNADCKFRRFVRPTSAAQLEFLREVLDRNEPPKDEPEFKCKEYLGTSEEAQQARDELAASLGSMGISPLALERMMKELRDVTIEE